MSGKGRRRRHCIDYRHVIAGLRKKPRAFLYCNWQSNLLPTVEFCQIWEQLKTQFEHNQAAKLIVEALYLAASYNQEKEVAVFSSKALAQNNLTLARLQQQFAPDLYVAKDTLALILDLSTTGLTFEGYRAYCPMILITIVLVSK